MPITSPTASQTPVSRGRFGLFTELMVWRPGLDRARLRRRLVRTTLLSMPTLYVLLGVAAAVLSAHAKATAASLTLVTVSTLFAVVNVVRVVVAYRHADLDNHDHTWDRPCFLDRTPGEFYYRPSDFRGMTTQAADSVTRIIDSVRVVHTSPAAAWLDPDDLHEIHDLAWDVLRALDQSRTLRHVLSTALDTAVDTDLPGELPDAAQHHLDAIDQAVDDVLTCLHQAVLLVRAWEDKLASIESRASLRSTLDSSIASTADSVATVRHAAKTLPHNLFAHITAARDITHTGPFPWEHPAQPTTQAVTMPSTLTTNVASWWRTDRGSVTAELTLITPLLVLLLVCVAVVTHRGVDARIRLDDTAHHAARSASIERTTLPATDAAHATANSALANAGVLRASMTASINTADMAPSATITVTVTCTVNPVSGG